MHFSKGIHWTEAGRFCAWEPPKTMPYNQKKKMLGVLATRSTYTRSSRPTKFLKNLKKNPAEKNLSRTPKIEFVPPLHSDLRVYHISSFRVLMIFGGFSGNFTILSYCNHFKTLKTLFKHIKLWKTQYFHPKTLIILVSPSGAPRAPYCVVLLY